nr:Chain P, TYQRTRALV peptide from Nucleoprotein [synthetic construct]
TYQRTRALV